MAIIEVSSVSKQFKVPIKQNILKDIFHPNYKTVKAVDDISFSIKRGEAVGFLGPNGAGKTTTTKMLTGLIHPTRGDIKVLGFKPHERKSELLRNIGLVMGNKSGLNWDLTSRQTFNIYKKIYRIDEKKFSANLNMLSDLLNVTEHLDKPVRKLSLGERMKLEIIGAILHRPKILFLDEPTIGLDIVSRQNIRQFLKQIQEQEKITIILTSHDLDDIEQVCNKVIVINHGSIVFNDSLSNLKQSFNDVKYIRVTYTKDSKSQDSINKLTKDFELTYQKQNIVEFKSTPIKIPHMIAEITKHLSIVDIDISSIKLEEIIKNIFERKHHEI